jgi:hypothetical protein
LEFFDFERNVSSKRFQQALNHCCSIIFTQFMPRNVFLGQTPQNGGLGPKPQNFGKFWNFLILREASHQYASNKPSITAVALFLLNLCPEKYFWAKPPKMGDWGPNPKILEFF